MNVKPGDLALVVASSVPQSANHIGMVVEVLYAAPGGDLDSVFELPDGGRVRRSHPDHAWVCKKPYATPAWVTGRMTFYAVFRDCNLRPLRDPDAGVKRETDETLSV